MSTAPQAVSIGPANLPLASIDYTITTYRGQVFTARKSTSEITWVDGKTYALKYTFLKDQVGIDDQDLRTAMHERRSFWDVFFAEMTIAKLGEPTPVTNGHAAASGGDLQAQIAALKAENTALANAGKSPLEIEIARLTAENEALKAENAKGGNLSFKVSEKGAVSVYGLGRFPQTLYREQWERLFQVIPALQAFIIANAGKLTTKAAK